MSAVNETTIDAAALTWFGELGVGKMVSDIGRTKLPGPYLMSLFTPHSSPSLTLPHPSLFPIPHSSPSRTLATLLDTLLPKLLSGELSIEEKCRAMKGKVNGQA